MELYKKHISDLGRIVTGKTPRTSNAENYGGNIPFLTPSDDLSGKFAPQTVKTITEEGLSEVKNCLLPSKSVCVSCIGSDLGKVVITNVPTVTNQQFNSIIPTEEYDTDFIYYLMTIVGKHLNFLSKTSTAVPIINKSTFADFEIEVPSLENQRRIAKILSSLDNKIEVNRRINDNFIYQKLLEIISIWKIATLLNDNLEQQAQALFKSWFVDFEPFKDGEFVESELGMIPKGWRVGKLGELCQFKRGKNLLSKDAKFGDVPVVAGGLEPSCYHNISNTKSPVVTVSGSGANAGFMRMYYQEVWASDCSFIDTSCENLLFVYYFLSINRRLLKHAQTGAVQPHVKPADIHDFNIVIPPYNEIKKFQTKVSPIVINNGKNEQESKKLILLRDTLLPHLMSGELKVNDVTI
jgi:type I restriction enzyme S subunit